MADIIKSNHTLEEYSKKYINRKYRLLKYTKKEVEDFDKKYSSKIKGFLLKDRKWWLIGDTYYEIPKAPRLTWFRNLNAGVQASCCLLGAGVVATAVIVPTVMSLNHKTVVEEHKAVIDVEVTDVTCTQRTLDNGALEITLKYDTTNKEIKSLKVTMGDQILKLNSEYTFNDDKIIINKEVLDNNKTAEIIITPILENKIGTKSIILTKKSTEIEEGNTTEVIATLSDKATKTISAKSSDESVATVDGEDGKFSITGKKEGNATITFSCDGYADAILTVTVKEQAKTKRQQFIETNNAWYADFNKATTYYPVDKVTCKKYINGVESEVTLTDVIHAVDMDNNRYAVAFSEDFAGQMYPIAAPTYADDTFYDLLKDETVDGVEYTITADEITYVDTKATTKEASRVSFNKYGYLTSMIEKNADGTETGVSFTYSGAPTEYVKLEESSIELILSKDTSIKPTLSDGADKKITATTDGNYIKVTSADNKTFTITALNPGKQTVTFSCDGYTSATLTVTVKLYANEDVENNTPVADEDNDYCFDGGDGEIISGDGESADFDVCEDDLYDEEGNLIYSPLDFID